jgi:hypothetical protein
VTPSNEVARAPPAEATGEQQGRAGVASKATGEQQGRAGIASKATGEQQGRAGVASKAMGKEQSCSGVASKAMGKEQSCSGVTNTRQTLVKERECGHRKAARAGRLAARNGRDEGDAVARLKRLVVVGKALVACEAYAIEASGQYRIGFGDIGPRARERRAGGERDRFLGAPGDVTNACKVQ